MTTIQAMSGTAYMRVFRDGKFENLRIEDMRKAEFIERFDVDSGKFLDYLADRVRWLEDFLEREGYDAIDID